VVFVGKVRTNVSVDPALLSEARALGINLSATLEDRLRDLVKQAREARWLAENQGALEDANEFLKRHGLWSDGLRQF
jgi:antitoxin CcdA